MIKVGSIAVYENFLLVLIDHGKNAFTTQGWLSLHVMIRKVSSCVRQLNSPFTKKVVLECLSDVQYHFTTARKSYKFISNPLAKKNHNNNAGITAG